MLSRLAALFAPLQLVIEDRVVATLLRAMALILVLAQWLIPQDAQPSPASNLAATAAIASAQAAAAVVIGRLATSSVPLSSVQFHSALREDKLFPSPYPNSLQQVPRSTLASEVCAIAPQSDLLFHHVQLVGLFAACGKLSSSRLLRLIARFRASSS